MSEYCLPSQQPYIKTFLACLPESSSLSEIIFLCSFKFIVQREAVDSIPNLTHVTIQYASVIPTHLSSSHLQNCPSPEGMCCIFPSSLTFLYSPMWLLVSNASQLPCKFFKKVEIPQIIWNTCICPSWFLLKLLLLNDVSLNIEW